MLLARTTTFFVSRPAITGFVSSQPRVLFDLNLLSTFNSVASSPASTSCIAIRFFSLRRFSSPTVRSYFHEPYMIATAQPKLAAIALPHQNPHNGQYTDPIPVVTAVTSKGKAQRSKTFSPAFFKTKSTSLPIVATLQNTPTKGTIWAEHHRPYRPSGALKQRKRPESISGRFHFIAGSENHNADHPPHLSRQFQIRTLPD